MLAALNSGGSLAAPGGDARRTPFDPDVQPELFRGVLTRRVFAFLIDLVVLSVPVILGYLFIAVFGVVTLGLGWMLFWLAWPATVGVGASSITAPRIGGPHSATMGMRVMDLELRTWYGAPGYFVLGATHAVLFWVSVSFLSPARAAGRPVQRPPAPAARHHPGNRRHQQLGPSARRAVRRPEPGDRRPTNWDRLSWR